MQCCLLNGDHGWSTNVFHHQIFIGIGKDILLLVPILTARDDLVADKMRSSSLLLVVRLADVMIGLLLVIQVGTDGGSLKRIRNRACIADGLLVGVGMRLLVLLLHHKLTLPGPRRLNHHGRSLMWSRLENVF